MTRGDWTGWASMWRGLASPAGGVLSALARVAGMSSVALPGKPAVAILGLEVYAPSGNVDQASTTLARDLTEGLRSRAKSGTGPYQLASGSEKELIDEKLINNCDSEAIPCMAEIGKNLGADYLIYGRLEKKPDGYLVTINLLNVGKSKFEKARTPLLIPFGQSDAPAIAAAAKKAYNDLTGFAEGTLVVRANADRGTVLIDGEPKGNLTSGTATIAPLPEGRYTLAIEADGYSRSDNVTITVRPGETTTQEVTLTAGGVTAKPDDMKREITGTTSQSKGNGWKIGFGVAVVAGIASGGYWAYSYTQMTSARDKIPGELTAANMPGRAVSDADCGKADLAGIGSFQDACSAKDGTMYGMIGVGVSAVAIAITGVLAFKGGDEAAPVGSVARRGAKKRAISLTPIVSANGGGATFRLDW